MLVRGQLQSRSWTDKDGGKRYATEVIADDITFVDSKSDNAGNDSGAPAGGGYVPDAYATPSFSNTNAGNFEPVNADDDSLPF